MGYLPPPDVPHFISLNGLIIWIVFRSLLFRSDLDEILLMKKDASTTNDIESKNSIDVYFATCRFLSLFRENSTEYNDRLEHLCRYLLASLESENPRHSYIGVALNKELSIAWIRHIKLLLYKCCVCMEKLKPGTYLSAYNPNTGSFHFFFFSIFPSREPLGEFDISFISTHNDIIHITKHMGHSKVQKFDCPETGNVTTLQ